MLKCSALNSLIANQHFHDFLINRQHGKLVGYENLFLKLFFRQIEQQELDIKNQE